jgi:hypothetical protein
MKGLFSALAKIGGRGFFPRGFFPGISQYSNSLRDQKSGLAAPHEVLDGGFLPATSESPKFQTVYNNCSTFPRDTFIGSMMLQTVCKCNVKC